MKSRTTKPSVKETLKGLLSGSISQEQAEKQLRQGKDIVATVIHWGDGTYTMGRNSGMTEAQVLEATGAESIDQVIAIAFTSGQNMQL